MDIYIPNKYTTTYFSIVNKAFSEDRKRTDNRIYENHHIIPKAIGGPNEKENLVLLTPKEHYICHRLLPKMLSDSKKRGKMINALWAMINGFGNSERHATNSTIYERIKIEHSTIKSENMKGNKNHFYGKTHSKEFKQWFSENNPTKREDVKKKIRGPRPNFLPHNHFTGWSEEVKQKLRIANKGKTHTEGTKLKMSKAKSEKIWIKKRGEKSKHINYSEVDNFVSQGWELGRDLGKQRKKRKNYDQDYKSKMSKSLSRKIWVSKPEEKPKFINKEDLEMFINSGWVRGRKYL